MQGVGRNSRDCGSLAVSDGRGLSCGTDPSGLEELGVS
ncbi:hypothetical protein ASZ90_014621 [hydrocarbon metagenome]|uniref:Uncharacterized protein n=1 Tax=hydrocarbon metagenome TaxID=938273 RepID=A0A0W8F4C4_9ZZZZ